ncbi:cell adhesion molecule Dscam2-like [Parasteatoda tepidariorum]|uniref:cell adhesion molecule Dscam2-like n=1 Tax=Parasteatoda tepidariorum TaxID=114398 RepID=UPI0039BD845D
MIVLLMFLSSVHGSSNSKAPIIQPFTFPETASHGQRVTATCGILQGSKPITFQWLKDGEDISKIPNTSVDIQSEYSVLTISPATKQNVGNYSCIARNEMGMHTHYALFTLKESPVWIKEPENVVGVEGQKLEVTCLADGSPKPEITWTKQVDGRNENLAESVENLRNGSLIINNLKYQNAGEYICEAKNGIGNALQKKITIKVHGK